MGNKRSSHPVEQLSEEYDASDYDRLYDSHWTVLLGSKSCGKTTIFNQVKQISINNTSNNDIAVMIQQSCIDHIVRLWNVNKGAKYSSVHRLHELDLDDSIDLCTISIIISKIWDENKSNDPSLINDEMDYFLNKIDVVMNTKYVPSKEDIENYGALSWIKYTSIISKEQHRNYGTHEKIKSKLPNMKIVDFKKEPSFEEVYSDFGNCLYCVVYCVSLVDFCDGVENTSFFDAILKYFKDAFICIVFTKNDLFRNKLKNGYSISRYFGDEVHSNPNKQLYWKRKFREYNVAFPPDITSNIVLHFARNMFLPQDIVDLVCKYSINLEYAYQWQRDAYFEDCYQDALEWIKYQFKILQLTGSAKEKYIFCSDVCCNQICDVTNIMQDIYDVIITSGLKKPGFIGLDPL